MTTLSIATDGYLCGGTGTGTTYDVAGFEIEIETKEYYVSIDTEEYSVSIDNASTEVFVEQDEGSVYIDPDINIVTV